MIKTYTKDNQTYYEVYVCGAYSNGDRYQKRTRFDEEGVRLSSSRKAKQVEQALNFEMGLITKKDKWAFHKWHEECLNRMKIKFKASTVIYYENAFKKLIPKEWRTRDLGAIKKADVDHLIFEVLL